MVLIDLQNVPRFFAIEERDHTMRVLITGGAGFIGSHLAASYLKKGHEVYVIDDLSTGSIDNISYLKNVVDVQDSLNISIDTILNREILEKFISLSDVVFHLAAAVGVQYIIENPINAVKTNIHGTELVLELCDKYDKKVLLTSTSEVYGKHTHAPLKETDNTIYGPSSKCRWSYAASKYINECISLAYHQATSLQVVIVRLFNTIGPRQTGKYGMVVPRLAGQAIHDEPLTVFGDGSQTRTFVYIDDVVWALQRLVENDDAVGQITNIGGNEEISIYDLAGKIIVLGESSSTIERVPYDKVFGANFEDMERRVPCLEKISTLIGFRPQTSLNSMLYNVVKEMRMLTGNIQI